MKTIVAPTDFTTISDNAAEYAADLACVIGTNLSLLHVSVVQRAYSELAVPVENITESIAEAEDKIRLLREKLLERTHNKIKIYAELRRGDIVAEIDKYCASINPYAIVMGAESASSFQRFLMGGSTLSAVKQLSWPLIVVPPGVRFANIRKIGLACDFRKVIETIPLNEIKDMVKEFKAELHVIHVHTETGETYSDEIIEESAWLQEILVGLNPKYHFIKDTDIEKGIAEFADKNNLDLLIVIPKRHNLISKIFQHSHSKRLVLHTHIPIMAIHE